MLIRSVGEGWAPEHDPPLLSWIRMLQYGKRIKKKINEAFFGAHHFLGVKEKMIYHRFCIKKRIVLSF